MLGLFRDTPGDFNTSFFNHSIFEAHFLACWLANFAQSFFAATNDNLRRRAFAAALAPVDDSTPRERTQRRHWLGSDSCFNVLTWQSSYVKPNVRTLYESISANERYPSGAGLLYSFFLSTWKKCCNICLSPSLWEGQRARTTFKRVRLGVQFFDVLNCDSSRASAYSDEIRRYFGFCNCLSHCCGEPAVTRETVRNGHDRQAAVHLAAALCRFRAAGNGNG